jgi:hypothetical protein
MGIVLLWTNKVSLIHFLFKILIDYFIFAESDNSLLSWIKNSISVNKPLVMGTHNMEQNIPLFLCKQMDVLKGLRKFRVFWFLAPDLFLL